MTAPRKFDEQTHWDRDPGGLRAGGAGWAPPGADFFIDRADPYWGRVLDKARAAYGDPNMHFDTDSVGQDRRLAFGDGTPVPTDGSLAYHDAARNRTFLLNNDGSVSLLDPNGQAEQPIWPASFRRTANGTYAPIDISGHQVAPLTASPPAVPNGYHDANGVLTPKNEHGDYYVVDPTTGQRTYFDKDGKPITAAQFGDAAPAAGPALSTDEQQSGRAADAVRKLHGDLQNRYSQISDAEGKLSEVLLNAHATTADGQQKLQAIQQKIVAAVNNAAFALDTPAGEQAFLKFLRSQAAQIGGVLQSGTLTADDQSKAAEALANLYAADPGSGAGAGDAAGIAAGVPATPPSESASAPVELGLGPEEPMPDPTLSDLGLSRPGSPPAADPLSSLASALPAALGAVPTGAFGGVGADPLASLGGLAAPLAGLATQLGDQPRRDETDERTSDNTGGNRSPETSDDRDAPKHQETQADSHATPPAAPEPAGSGGGAPPAAPAGPPVPMTTVSLPDGSTANARTAALAKAVESYLSGTPVDAAYRQAGFELPPPGTPVTNPVDPSGLSCGAIGMFRDHYVVALSPVKALQDGQVVALSSVAAGPGFLGWMDPTAVRARAPADQLSATD